MERAKSPPSDHNTPPPPSDHQNQDFAANFTSMYHTIFPPKSPKLSTCPSSSPSSSSSTLSADIHVNSTEHRLNQARFILEYHQLCDHYDLCLARLQTLTKELELLHQENADLRLANTELVKLLSLSSKFAAVRNRFNRSGGGGGYDVSDFSRKCVIEPNRFEKRNVERNTLPKSISVRSSGYSKLNQDDSSGDGPSRQRVASQLVSGSVQQRVYVPGGGKREEEEKEGMEFEVYNQGMWKTELCNKWQETGTCPYGVQCQFAHGITELRPIIRHPRYKTQVCKMVLAGDTCPYGHRCHFRHSLTEQERLIMGPR